MAKKRPDFNLPSTKRAAASDSKPTDWVYRSDADADAPGKEATKPAAVKTEAPKREAPKAIAPAPEPAALLESPIPQDIIDKYAKYAAGVGTIPLPIFDLIALTTVQVKMIAALADHYQLKFDEQAAKSLIASAIASYGAAGFAYRAGRWMTRSIPVVGSIGNFLLLPWVAYSMTFSMGQLFARHFAAGGTLFDYQASKSNAA